MTALDRGSRVDGVPTDGSLTIDVTAGRLSCLPAATGTGLTALPQAK